MIKVKFDWAKNKIPPAAVPGAGLTGGSGSSIPGKEKAEVKGQPLGIPVGVVTQPVAQRDLNGGGAATGPTGGTIYGGSLEEELSNSRGSVTSFGGVGSAFSTATPTAAGANQICCLTEDGVRCSRVAGNASYSKRIQKTVQQKRLRLSIDNSARHIYICDHHKGMIQSIRTSGKRKRKDSGDVDDGANSNDGFGMSYGYDNNATVTGPGGGAGPGGDSPQVDLCTLQVNTLRRYKKHYRIQTRPGINKSMLADHLARHFKSIPVNEKEAITYFIYMVKSNRNKLDQMKGLGPSVFVDSQQ